MEEIITDEAGRLPGGQGYVAQAAIGVVVAILEPLQVGLYDALGVIGYQAVLADVDPVLEAEQVGHLPLGALAKPHGRPPLSVLLIHRSTGPDGRERWSVA